MSIIQWASLTGYARDHLKSWSPIHLALDSAMSGAFAVASLVFASLSWGQTGVLFVCFAVIVCCLRKYRALELEALEAQRHAHRSRRLAAARQKLLETAQEIPPDIAPIIETAVAMSKLPGGGLRCLAQALDCGTHVRLDQPLPSKQQRLRTNHQVERSHDLHHHDRSHVTPLGTTKMNLKTVSEVAGS